MTHYIAFCLTFGALLCIVGIIAVWLFRQSSAPTLAKALAPALVVALAILAPYQVGAMLGFPTSVQPPDKAELIAYVAHDQDGRVDLWLKAGEQPRAYEVPLTDKLKKTLHDAEGKLAGGERVMLQRRKATHAAMQDQASPPPTFEIAEEAFSLPRKDR